MEKASNTFDEIFKDLGIERRVTVELIRSRWEEIIGQTIACHTFPSSCDTGQLLILVDSPEWLHELRYHENTIREKLKPHGFDRIRFKLGRVRTLKRSATDPRRIKKLTASDREFIEETSSCITDSQMREQIKKAIKNSIAFGKNHQNP